MRCLVLACFLAATAVALAVEPNADAQLDELRAGVSKLLAMRTTVADHLKELQEEVAEVQGVDGSKMSETLARIELQHTRIAEINEKLRELTLVIEDADRAAKVEAQKRAEEQQQAVHDLESLRTDAAATENSLAMRRADLEAVRRSIDETTNELMTCAGEQAELKTLLTKVQKEAGELGPAVSALNQDKSSISSALGKLRENQREYTEQIEDARKAQAEAEAASSELDGKLAKLEETLNKRREELSTAVAETHTQTAAPVDESAKALVDKYGSALDDDEEDDDDLDLDKYSLLQTRSKLRTRRLRARRIGEGAGSGSGSGSGAGSAVAPQTAPQAEVHETVGQLAAARASATKLKNGATALVSKLKSMCDEADQLQAELDKFQGTKDMLEGLVRMVEGLQQAFEAEKSKSLTLAQREKDMLARHVTLMTELRSNIDELQRSIADGLSELKSIEIRIDEAKHNLDTVANKAKECVEASQGLRDNLASLTLQVNGLRDEYRLLETENKRMEDERIELERLLNDETSGLKAQADAAKSEADVAAAKVDQLGRSIAGYESGIASYDSRIAQERATQAQQ
mmetsp:Transcript_29376/g.95879  ORF Transcript_29376/g.95879 Transcript_29376/m.95879 type:complete len:576 (+) Transcript_29376:26-1753(+)